MARMKEVGAGWLVQMAARVADNPQFLVNSFMKAGINGALDGYLKNDESMKTVKYQVKTIYDHRRR